MGEPATEMLPRLHCTCLSLSISNLILFVWPIGDEHDFSRIIFVFSVTCWIATRCCVLMWLVQAAVIGASQQASDLASWGGIVRRKTTILPLSSTMYWCYRSYLLSHCQHSFSQSLWNSLASCSSLAHALSRSLLLFTSPRRAVLANWRRRRLLRRPYTIEDRRCCKACK
jgi:hypothetical protein